VIFLYKIQTASDSEPRFPNARIILTFRGVLFMLHFYYVKFDACNLLHASCVRIIVYQFSDKDFNNYRVLIVER
jgi:hypothetical protein